MLGTYQYYYQPIRDIKCTFLSSCHLSLGIYDILPKNYLSHLIYAKGDISYRKFVTATYKNTHIIPTRFTKHFLLLLLLLLHCISSK